MAARRRAADAAAERFGSPTPRAAGAVSTGAAGSPGRMLKAGAYAWQDHPYLPPPAYRYPYSYFAPRDAYDADLDLDHERPYLRYWDPYGVWRHPYAHRRYRDMPYTYYPYTYPPYYNSPFAPPVGSNAAAAAAAAAAGAAAARATAEALSPDAERERVRRATTEAERALLRAGRGTASPRVLVNDGGSTPRRRKGVHF